MWGFSMKKLMLAFCLLLHSVGALSAVEQKEEVGQAESVVKIFPKSNAKTLAEGIAGIAASIALKYGVEKLKESYPIGAIALFYVPITVAGLGGSKLVEWACSPAETNKPVLVISKEGIRYLEYLYPWNDIYLFRDYITPGGTSLLCLQMEKGQQAVTVYIYNMNISSEAEFIKTVEFFAPGRYS